MCGALQQPLARLRTSWKATVSTLNGYSTDFTPGRFHTNMISKMQTPMKMSVTSCQWSGRRSAAGSTILIYCKEARE